ncbi:MAG: HAD family hydrolase [Planctomycetota bacterium]
MQAVTLDFYETLIHHRGGSGRGKQYGEYLSSAGLSADPWEHRVLYDVFEHFAAAHGTATTEESRRSFWIEFTRRLFERTSVRGPGSADHTSHADAIRDIMGPQAFSLFEDALPLLRSLRARGLALGIVSDWQRGLSHFVDELGIGACVDVVVASAEAGCAKPDPRLFELARERLGVSASEILHVGDSLEDVEGAQAAGFRAALLVRSGEPPAVRAPVIRGLHQVLELV